MPKKFGIASRYVNNPKRNAGIVAAFKKGTFGGTDLAKKFELSVSQTYRIIGEAGEIKTKKVRR